MMCRGIEDLTRALPIPGAPAPEKVLDALQTLLDFAAAILEPARCAASSTAGGANRWDPTPRRRLATGGSAHPIG